MLRFRQIFEIWRWDNSLTQALTASYTMLERTDRMYRLSSSALRENDNGDICANIFEEDRTINQFHQEVRRKVLRHLAVAGGANLVPGLVLSCIVGDIERIGDYTKNISELAVAHNAPLSCGFCEQEVSKMEKAVEDIFSRIVQALKTSDQAEARSLIVDNMWIRKSCDDIMLNLINGRDNTISSGSSVVLALYVRYLKRITEHLMNILSSVVNPYESIGYRDDIV
ncbi:MAG: PhoU domain-containing protein [Gammaproteobacteria bacterium]|nr:PhoU domain-containing protein [Gammaproteobacteria bacterium]